jgi:HNH endonuclease
MRACLDQPCPRPATYRGRCRVHNQIREREIKRKRRRVYDSRKWRDVIRERKLTRDPLCQADGCGAVAEEVHHIDDDAGPYTLKNLVSMCRACHSRITRAEQMGG